MHVAVFGGTGFIGRHVTRELIERGHTPVLLVRPGSEEKITFDGKTRTVTGTIADRHAVERTLEGTGAVVYAIGIIRQDRARGITYEALHVDGVGTTVNSCLEQGVKRLLLVSANGVGPSGTVYEGSKFRGEEIVRSSGLDWTILRPSVVFGDPRGAMELASQLKRDMVSIPAPLPLFHRGILPWRGPSFKLAPVHVRDLARIIATAIETGELTGRTAGVCGPDELDWETVARTVAEASGKRKSGVPVPLWAVKAAAALLDRFRFFPVTREQLEMLGGGNTCDSRELFERFGIDPIPFTVESLSYLGKTGGGKH